MTDAASPLAQAHEDAGLICGWRFFSDTRQCVQAVTAPSAAQWLADAAARSRMSDVPAAFSREQGCTEAEWLGWLPGAVDGRALALQSGQADFISMGRKLLAAFDQPFLVGDSACQVGLTIGFALGGVGLIAYALLTEEPAPVEPIVAAVPAPLAPPVRPLPAPNTGPRNRPMPLR